MRGVSLIIMPGIYWVLIMCGCFSWISQLIIKQPYERYIIPFYR